MNTIFEQMLQRYDAKSAYEQENAVKEIMQEIVLCGLSRAGFFKEAAFYGGTALRIFCGLDRFSEDLDFSLAAPDADFDLAAYFPVLEKEVRAFGLNVTIQEKKKTKESNVQSAFLKGDTREHLLLFYGNTASGGGCKALYQRSRNAGALVGGFFRTNYRSVIDTAMMQRSRYELTGARSQQNLQMKSRTEIPRKREPPCGFVLLCRGNASAQYSFSRAV